MNKSKREQRPPGNESQFIEFKSNFGEGVIEALSSAGAATPVFEAIGDFFKVTVFPVYQRRVNPASDAHGKYEGVNGGVNGGVFERANDLLALIEATPGINSKRIVSLTGKPQRSIERWLKPLPEYTR